MEGLQELIAQIPSIEEVIRWGGTLALIAIVFAETGLLVGFFLPGDSLLVTAGLFAARGDLNVAVLLVTLSIAAIVGDAVGYTIGRRLGPKLFKKEDSLLFKRKHLVKAHEFYERYGGKTIVIARFVPIIRTFAPTVAGAAEMTYSKFAAFNVFGGILWVFSMVLGGYALGSVIPNIDKYIHYVIAVVVFLSLLPPVFEWWRERRRMAAEKTAA
ncbi:MAG: VTT domain-containing protein [Blastocatellia bacterium]|jgi:membrane-associated protein|nr:VTT domain-containing protein [Blastocatellia bacterium]